MSVQSYLDDLKNSLLLRDAEKESIKKSISTISTRIDSYFAQEVSDHFQFGSYTRGTILPRKADVYSDIDYMVIFKNEKNYKPQTYLDYLRAFGSYYYKKSEIHQSHPTIVLELNHIKFELVPAIKDYWGYLSIPSPRSGFTDWINTDPNGFNKILSSANVSNNSKIKPLVRIMKYWNASNGYYLSSYLLEKWIAETYYFGCTSLKEYLYTTFTNLTYNWNDSQTYKNSVDRAKNIIENVKYYERNNMTVNAELEIKKLLPEL